VDNRLISTRKEKNPMLPESLVIERFEGANQAQRVLRLNGPLTATTAVPFQNALRGENAGTMILDLSQVPYMDSVGLGSLVGMYVSCQKAGRRIALSGLNPRVWQLFQITKLEPFFLVFPSLADAVEALTNAGRA
jgi:anti-anti-sigma factor